VHFWLSLIFMNLIFLPMFVQGLDGMHRRMYDGGVTYAGAADPASGVVGLSQLSLDLNKGISHAAWMLGLAQIPFIINFFVSMRRGRKAESDNPWQATTLEWQTPTPPPHGNFVGPLRVYRGPYDYSPAGGAHDYRPQNEPPARP
jgi:cytochrome c oxidase subunit I